MSRRPPHRPQRSYPDAERAILECELEECVHCGGPLVPSGTWHVRKYVQSMRGPMFVAGKSKTCDSPDCSHHGHHYHASGVLRISLPQSTYGLDVLVFIGWQHEHEHKQFVEIQGKLNRRGIEVSERHVGRLYRQFLALLGGMNERVKRRLDETAEEHGGLIWGIDALQPEGHGTLLYVLYEVLGGTPVGWGSAEPQYMAGIGLCESAAKAHPANANRRYPSRQRRSLGRHSHSHARSPSAHRGRVGRGLGGGRGGVESSRPSECCDRR